MAPSQEEVYLLGRDAEESARLNAQHELVSELMGDSIIHSSVPIEQVESVADIATGTGVWLRELASILVSRNPQPSRPYYLYGTDISGEQFQPFDGADKQVEFHLEEHNCLEPFPIEHHGRYDFVHVRFLVGALKTHEFGTAIDNIYTLLKPGGYLQWDEGDISSFETTADPEPPIVTEIIKDMTAMLTQIGLCPTAPVKVEEEAKRAGFLQVRRERYDTRDKPHLKDTACRWFVKSASSTIFQSLLKSGRMKDEGEAREQTTALLEEFERSGAMPLFNVQVIVGRKPS